MAAVALAAVADRQLARADATEAKKANTATEAIISSLKYSTSCLAYVFVGRLYAKAGSCPVSTAFRPEFIYRGASELADFTLLYGSTVAVLVQLSGFALDGDVLAVAARTATGSVPTSRRYWSPSPLAIR